jgi:hypothetical protein
MEAPSQRSFMVSIAHITQFLKIQTRNQKFTDRPDSSVIDMPPHVAEESNNMFQYL